MATDLGLLLGDLRAEGDDLDAMVADLPAADWARPTPAPGWTIAHQIAHLAWTDVRALLAATDEAAFQADLQDGAADPQGHVDSGAAQGAAQPPAELLSRWRAGRTAVLTTLAGLPAQTRLPWFGPPMAPASMATARLMETWAHGQDVADTLAVTRPPTSRLRHVTYLAVRTRDFAFAVHGLPPPAEPFRVELAAPDGATWTWGPEDAAQRVTGPALDLCLLAVQRRHRDNLALVAKGADADRWLDIAQCFAGPPGPGRAGTAAAQAGPTGAMAGGSAAGATSSGAGGVAGGRAGGTVGGATAGAVGSAAPARLTPTTTPGAPAASDAPAASGATDR
jgi:uncharacterized protein (TIGR03084 family)